ncbi:MAG: methyltransferase domain-containing protein [Burkholderiales bacterium]|nr:methyltransferase domain-containing protein [Burkholderiales bacterium]
MSLARSYRLIAPFYDATVARATAAARRASLAHLPHPGKRVLIAGIGTGLDVPLLPQGNRYVGVDLTRAMLERVPRTRANLRLVQGDAMRLPFPDAAFHAVVLHLILAVVPDARRALAEAERVVKPGGLVLVFDKFLRPGERGRLRRALNPVARRIATRLDVVFEDALAAAPALAVAADEPALAAGWFRRIRLVKRRR